MKSTTTLTYSYCASVANHLMH